MSPRADDPITPVEDAKALIDACFHELAPASVRRLGRGWDHDVFVVNEAWVFRFPRHAMAADALHLERVVMPWIAAHVPLAVPVPTLVATRDGGSRWAFAGHRLVPGETLCDAALDPSSRAALALTLARFVRALHALDLAAAPVPLAPDPLGRFDVARRTEPTRVRLDGFVREGLLSDRARARLDRALADCPPRSDVADLVVHADLHTRNLLCDPHGALVGAIDWVDVHAGERATDLATAYAVLPARARDGFFAAYGDVDSATRARARWRAITQTAGALAGAIERNDDRFARASAVALIEIADD